MPRLTKFNKLTHQGWFINKYHTKHPVPDVVEPSFVIFDILAL